VMQRDVDDRRVEQRHEGAQRKHDADLGRAVDPTAGGAGVLRS
jgi:hypothetical protein